MTSVNEEIKEFETFMKESSTWKILDHARESRASQPKNIKPYDLTLHPQWMQKEYQGV
jgi:hypothetical protein